MKKIIRITAIVFIILVLILIGVVFYLGNDILNTEEILAESTHTTKEKGWDEYILVEEPTKATTKIESVENSVSILLLGVDSRNNDLTGRSDSLMLLTINYDTNTTNLVSFPRDSYVFIPTKGYDKLNHSYAYGKADLTKETIENLLEINIDYTVTINFNSFVNVINVLNGIDVEVPFSFTEKDTKGNIVAFNKGNQTLNGEESLAYSRMRKQDSEGDLGRGKRQQQVIESVIKKTVSFDSLFKIKDIYSEIKSNIVTDLTITEILSIANNKSALNNINKMQLEAVPIMMDGISYMDINKESLESLKIKLHSDLSATK